MGRSSNVVRTSRGAPKGGRGNTRQKIKETATKLLIMRGVRGFSYADIAERLHITTTNIHHHFGKKEHLIDEVVLEYVADASSRHRDIWTNGSFSLRSKIQHFVAFNFERYRKFNKGTRQGQPWSLIGRLRLDAQNLSPQSVKALASFGADVQAFIHVAVSQAREKRELASEAPTEDIALLLSNMVNSTAIFTQVAGNFKVVRDVFESATRVIIAGYEVSERTAILKSNHASQEQTR